MIIVTVASDTDDDSYRPSKRHRADFRPPTRGRAHDDTDNTQSSPGRSQPGHSREDIPMTDQTEDPDEVLGWKFWLFPNYALLILNHISAKKSAK